MSFILKFGYIFGFLISTFSLNFNECRSAFFFFLWINRMIFEEFTFFSRLIIVLLLVHQISLTYQDLIWIILYFAFVYRLHHFELSWVV